MGLAAAVIQDPTIQQGGSSQATTCEAVPHSIPGKSSLNHGCGLITSSSQWWRSLGNCREVDHKQSTDSHPINEGSNIIKGEGHTQMDGCWLVHQPALHPSLGRRSWGWGLQPRPWFSAQPLQDLNAPGTHIEQSVLLSVKLVVPTASRGPRRPCGWHRTPLNLGPWSFKCHGVQEATT